MYSSLTPHIRTFHPVVVLGKEVCEASARAVHGGGAATQHNLHMEDRKRNHPDSRSPPRGGKGDGQGPKRRRRPDDREDGELEEGEMPEPPPNQRGRPGEHRSPVTATAATVPSRDARSRQEKSSFLISGNCGAHASAC